MQTVTIVLCAVLVLMALGFPSAVTKIDGTSDASANVLIRAHTRFAILHASVMVALIAAVVLVNVL